METPKKTAEIIHLFLFIGTAIACLTPYISPTIALFGGLVFALTLGNPLVKQTHKGSKILLQISIIGLGFGMNLNESLKTGMQGISFTIFSVVFIMIMGVLIGRWVKLSTRTAYLISAGTAICGGSAIAAITPVIRANEVETSVSLATVFILNAIGLIVFPQLGHLLHLTQHQFGLWAAIAIHDTSSVVGAGASYGNEALKVATMVKLTRALWIIPLAFISTFVFKDSHKRITIPWFILLFVVAMIFNTYMTIPSDLSDWIGTGAKRMLTLTLFLIGASLNRKVLRTTGLRPLLLGVILWVLIAIVSLMAIIVL